MKALLAALLLAFCLLCACHRAEQDDPAKNTFQETKAKAERGNARAQCEFASRFYYGEGVAKDFVEAVKWFRKAAEQGNALAQYMLGVCYGYGYGVAKDYAEAGKWWRKAAEQGNVDGQYLLGACYKNGRGVEEDYVEAYAWLNLASATDKDAAEQRGDLEKTMSPQQIADAQARTKELRAIVETKAKAAK